MAIPENVFHKKNPIGSKETKYAFVIRFKHGGYYHSIFAFKKHAQVVAKKVNGKVIKINKRQYQKIYGKHDWGIFN